MNLSINKNFVAGLMCLVTGAVAYGQKNVESSKKSIQAADQTTIGARLGIVNVSSLDNGVISYGAFGDHTVDNRVVVGGTLDYWSMSTAGVSATAISINDVSVGGNGKFIFTDVKSSFKPYATAGLSMHRLSLSKSETADTDSAMARYREKNNDVSSSVGIDVGGGVVYNVQPQIDVNGQVLYRRLTNPGVNFNQLALTAGVGYRM